MTQKAERGTKRTCDSCNARFYDLNREEIICPMCGAVFELATPQQPEVADAIVEETESKPVPKVVPVPEGDADDIDGGDDLAELDDDDTKVVATDDDDAFLPDEEDGEADVSGIIGGPIITEEEES